MDVDIPTAHRTQLPRDDRVEGYAEINPGVPRWSRPLTISPPACRTISSTSLHRTAGGDDVLHHQDPLSWLDRKTAAQRLAILPLGKEVLAAKRAADPYAIWTAPRGRPDDDVHPVVLEMRGERGAEVPRCNGVPEKSGRIADSGPNAGPTLGQENGLPAGPRPPL